jgi:hypothetical protein
MEPKNKLGLTLLNIYKRFCFLLFSKLINYRRNAAPDVHYIPHYDIQCESANIIADTLNTKVKIIKLRVFYLIKFYKKCRLTRRTSNHRANQSVDGNPATATMRNQTKSARIGRNQSYTTRTANDKLSHSKY